jgi:[protein-PII] uridylyltransferase
VADLVEARHALLGAHPRHRRLSAGALRTALVDLHDFWLSTRAASVGMGPGTALVAVGGLGRRELAPHSDLDLVLLHDGKRDVGPLADALWYPLWDARIVLDHSVRTVGQAVGVAATDLRAAFGLLEGRRVAGDSGLAADLDTAVRTAWRAGIRGRVGEIVESAAHRWSRIGDVAHRVEPDLKSGHGGLRDVYLLDALAAGQLIDRPGPEVAEARTLLLDVRTELHRLSGRGCDVLRAQDADEVAAALALGDRFDLARALSGAARTVVYAVDVALRTARAAVPTRGVRALRYSGLSTLRGSLSRGPVRRPLDDGVVEQAGEVVLAREAQPTRDPALVLRVAATAARTGLPVAAGTLATLADTAPELRGPWPRAALEELLSLLGAGRGAVDVVEAMDRTGLWGRLLPEWGAVRDLPPRDRAHVWTVDRHLVETAAHAARLTTVVARPDLLLLGALLHDIGKGRGGDHSVVGAALAEQVGRRIGLWPCDVALLSAMVRHHLLLPHTATRRDLDDPVTVQRVVETLGGDGVLLELLVTLAEADALATGPGVWSDWKAQLVGDLGERCRAALAGRPLPGPAPLTDDQRRLAETGGVHVEFVEQAPATGGVLAVTVVAPDRPGLHSRAAGVLALHSLQVHSADLRSHDGAAVDVFGVSPVFGSPPDPALLRQELVRALDGSLPLASRLEAKERDYGDAAADTPRAKVLWFDDEATGAVVLELRAGDRIGLLHRVAAALEGVGVDVQWARVATLGSSVVDSFCLVGGGENGTLRPDQRQRVERAVLTAAG